MNNIVPNLKRYCSPMLNVLEFKTSNERFFIMFDVPNAKCANALRKTATKPHVVKFKKLLKTSTSKIITTIQLYNT